MVLEDELKWLSYKQLFQNCISNNQYKHII